MAMTHVKDMNIRPKYAPTPPSAVQRSAGRMSEAAEYQQTLHRNLIYLASLAEDAQSLLAELQMPPDQPTPPVSSPQAVESNAIVKNNKQMNVVNQNSSMPTEQQIRIQQNPMGMKNLCVFITPNPGNPYLNSAEMQPVMQAQYQQQQQVQPAVSASPQQMQHTVQNPSTAAASHPITPVSSTVAVQQHVPPTTVYIQQQSGQQIYYQQYQQGAPGQQMYGAVQQIPHQQAPPRPVDATATYYQHQPRYQQYQIYQQQQQQAAPQSQQPGQQQPYMPTPQQPPQVVYATSSSHRPPYVQQNDIPQQQQQQISYAVYGQPPQQQMYAPQQSYAPPQQQQQQPQS
uniref:SS18 N-terminal domain-containing protein n=1 Tax=Romanomermis culicivorax TaxID=13658 RepID=A0A915HI02_ROMCU